MPALSPQGPILVVVSLGEQRASVYRNGVRIGLATVSTGKTGYETPTGVFTILQKHREHYSNRYNNAPMPFMQRLTWDGIALHAGNVPGYRASHGCVRLPYAFSELLFGLTTAGMTVVITDAASPAPTVVYPTLFVAAEQVPGAPVATAVSALPQGTLWAPERSPVGPLTIVLSTRDHLVLVLRNGMEIGRSPVALGEDALPGTRAYMLLAGREPELSTIVANRPALRWLTVADKGGTEDHGLHATAIADRLTVPPQFAQLVYDILQPGTTVVVTDEGIGSSTQLEPTQTVLSNDEAATLSEPLPTH